MKNLKALMITSWILLLIALGFYGYGWLAWHYPNIMLWFWGAVALFMIGGGIFLNVKDKINGTNEEETEEDVYEDLESLAKEYGTKIHYKGEGREWHQRLIGDRTESFKAGFKAAIKRK